MNINDLDMLFVIGDFNKVLFLILVLFVLDEI